MILLKGGTPGFEPRGTDNKKKRKTYRLPPSSVIRLGLEGADAPSRAFCLQPPNPLERGHSWVRAHLGKATKKWDTEKCPIPFGDPPGARTQDPILKRDVLYLLS